MLSNKYVLNAPNAANYFRRPNQKHLCSNWCVQQKLKCQLVELWLVKFTQKQKLGPWAKWLKCMVALKVLGYKTYQLGMFRCLDRLCLNLWAFYFWRVFQIRLVVIRPVDLIPQSNYLRTQFATDLPEN
jgi:hypothetical protein